MLSFYFGGVGNMKHFIKVHILLCFGVCVLLLCLLAGTGTYIISNKILREAAEVKSLSLIHI